MMALAVAGVTSLVILAALAAALIDRESARESAIRLYELADAAAEGIVVAWHGEIINVNQRIVELTDRPAKSLLESAFSATCSIRRAIRHVAPASIASRR